MSALMGHRVVATTGWIWMLRLLLLAGTASGQQETADPQLVAEAQRLIEEADRLSSDGDIQQAIEVSKQAVEANRKVHGENGRKTALAKSHLAFSFSRAGDHQQSLELWQQALEVARKELGDDHLSSITLLENVAGAYSALKQPVEAIASYKQLLGIDKRTKREKTFEAANHYNLMGVEQHAIGDYGGARASLERSIAIYRQVAGKDVVEMARPANRLGMMLREQGDSRAAMRAFEEGLRLCRTFYGENHAETANAYNNIGAVHIENGDYPAAARALSKALSIRVEVLGVEHPDVAFSFENVAAILTFQRKYAEAEQLLQTALGIRRKHRDSEPYLLSNVLNNLAVVNHRQGNSEKAVEAAREALEITSDTIGDHHPLTFVQWENLTSLQMNADDLDGASGSMDHVRRAIRRHVAKILPGLTDREQVQFLQTRYKKQLHVALSMGYLHPDHDSLRNASATWMINGKAVTHESLAEREQLLQRSARDVDSAGSDRLMEVRKQLAAASMGSGNAVSKDERIARIDALQEEERQLYREVSLSLNRPESFGQWVELDAIRNEIPDDGVFIDICRLDVYDFNNRNPELTEEKFQPARYVAWMIPAAGKGEVRIVDLGLASELEASVSRLREAIAQTPRSGGILEKQGEAAAVKKLDALLADVRDRVWTPLAEELPENTKKLIISPDGDLWLMPWAAVPITNDRCLIEDYSIRFLTSGRDLLALPVAGDLKASPPLLVADPDFDLSVEALRKLILSLFPMRELGPTQTRNSSGAGNLGRMPRLPNTKVESDFIAPSVEKIAGEPPRTYSGELALESVVKDVRRPRLMVLSTHGFFLPDEKESSGKAEGKNTRTGKAASPELAIENPLLRCGLMFAGCNARQSTGGDDGILTGLEVVGIDLVGTELIVMSACETGLGKVDNGEGVAGLRQAFQLAGAKAVVATLWQVPDRDSALLMNDFFANLADGQDRAEALRQAQLKRIETRRNRYGAAHPFFWAAWTVTGQ